MLIQACARLCVHARTRWAWVVHRAAGKARFGDSGGQHREYYQGLYAAKGQGRYAAHVLHLVLLDCNGRHATINVYVDRRVITASSSGLPDRG